MKFRDIVIGAVVLGLLVGGALWIRNSRLEKQELAVTTPTFEERVAKTFNGLTVPEDVEKTELKDVSGGDSFGIATRTEVLADLPDGNYSIYLDGKKLGNMRVAKGGYLFEGKLSGQKVEVKSGTKTILEGSF